MPDPVVTSRDGHTLVLTLNRPHVRNAIDRRTAQAIAEAMDLLDQDPDIRVGILTGAGGTFCSGMDLAAFHRGEEPYVHGRGFAGIAESPPRKPLIAAVEGSALAGGFELALCCDLIVAGASARFGIPEVTRGLVAAGGGLLRLRDRIPYHQAMRLALTGDPVPAARAYELGLLAEVAPDGEALEVARALAGRIGVNAPLAVDASKKIIVAAASWPPADAFRRQAPLVREVLASTDAREGAAAFVEKRTPAWTGQ